MSVTFKQFLSEAAVKGRAKLKTIWAAYSKENTGHDVCTTATLPAYTPKHRGMGWW